MTFGNGSFTLRLVLRGAGFQTCCIADFQIGRSSNSSGRRRVWKPAIQQTWKSALRLRC